MKPYYITTAIAYASGIPHIGNVYEIILADAIARFKREEGYDVFFQTGSDEHGQKIELRAREAGKTPQAFVDDAVANICRMWNLMDTSYDKFIRTTDSYHKEQVQKMFKRMYEQGDIYKGFYEGMYCTACESFFTDTQLTDGCCPDCGGKVYPAKEDAYFFKMSKYADRLIAHIHAHPEFIEPASRKNEMMNNFLLPGLQDLCVSRTSFTWGIPVDFDEGHIVYVWLDALSNYITGIGYDAGGHHDPAFTKYWPADLHLIGKDIVRFHTIYWPIFLMSLDIPLPKKVFGHPWLLQGEGKMSKSKGNVLYADHLTSLFGVDAIRYYVLHEMPYDNDGVISYELITERYNTNLANILGNLVSRTLAMTNKYFKGIVTDSHTNEAIDEDLRKTVLESVAAIREKMDSLRIADAITSLWNIFKRANKYIDETMPWLLARDPAAGNRLQTVLYHLTESIVIGASLLKSFMPETAASILSMCGAKKRSLDEMEAFGLLPSGTKVAENPPILFARLDMDEVLKKAGYESESAAPEAPTPSPPQTAAGRETAGAEEKPLIAYDDFARLRMQVGEIISCEAVKGSKKLLCSQVRIGSETRQILSGIRTWYTPEDLVGKKVCVLVNLAPRKMAGLLSEGMLLCAEDGTGNLALLQPETDIPSGAEIC